MYVLCFTLDEVLAHSPAVVYLAASSRGKMLSDGTIERTNQITVTCDWRGLLLGARIVIERDTLFASSEQKRIAAMAARAERARGLVEDRLRQHGCELILGGMLSEPGFYDDLQKIQTDHQLWTLTRDQYGSVTDLLEMPH